MRRSEIVPILLTRLIIPPRARSEAVAALLSESETQTDFKMTFITFLSFITFETELPPE